MFRSIYFGKISKEKTERLLELYGKEGSFLTRDSESERGAYCLCVRRTPFVHTYKISQYHGGWAVKTPPGVKPQCFETLNDLIDCYRAAAPDSMAPLLHPLEKRLVSDNGENQGKRFSWVAFLKIDTGLKCPRSHYTEESEGWPLGQHAKIQAHGLYNKCHYA
uniref:SH2 domain-containing protein 1A-like n=1 Tax=Paramormyrops kingsleyae TaxID=1676925 RepID=A0A3B3RPM0_9TELE